MSKGKKRRQAKQKAKRIMKARRGKNAPFDLQNSPKKYRGFSNKYCYKTNIHRLIYKDASFSNIKFQASNMTDCNYRNSKLNCIDYVGCNLKGSNFTGAKLRNVLFMCCHLNGVNFTNCKFQNVYFITTNIEKCKGFPNDGFIQMRTCPKLDIDEKISIAVDRMCQIKAAHIFHVANNKLNMWTIKIVLDKYGAMTGDLLLRLSRERKLKALYSLGAYCNFIESHYDVC